MEPWLTPDSSESSDDERRNLHKSLDQVKYWIQFHLESVPREALWWQPAEQIPSIGMRIEHIVFGTRALGVLAFDPDYSPITPPTQNSAGWTTTFRAKKALIRDLATAIEEIKEKLSVTSTDELEKDVVLNVEMLTPPEAKGRLRSFKGDMDPRIRRSVIMHHIVDHTAFHAGQLILLLRLWEAQRE
ncbi:hypothetical protein MJD09_24595 [bacterium]|nr:hypothetical protein [bacterium]